MGPIGTKAGSAACAIFGALLLLAVPALADDPLLRYRAPSLAPKGGAVAPIRAPSQTLAPRDVLRRETEIRAGAANDARFRDNMRSIQDGVLRRYAKPETLVLVGEQRKIEEERAGMKAREQWRQLELDEGWPGRPLGPVTQRVFERAGLSVWVEDRKDAVDESVKSLEASSERPPEPALRDTRR